MLSFLSFCVSLNSGPKGHRAVSVDKAPSPSGVINGNERGLYRLSISVQGVIPRVNLVTNLTDGFIKLKVHCTGEEGSGC